MQPTPPRRCKARLSGGIRGGWTLRVMIAMLVLGVPALLLFTGKGESTAPGEAQPQNLPAPPPDAIAWRVAKGDLPITLLAPGEIKARESTEIICQIQGEGKIIWIIPEGSIVKAGEKLVEIEVASLKENIIRQNVSVANAEAAFKSAESAVAIQESKNRSDLLVAENKLDIARLDLEKYRNGDFPQKLRQVESDIKIREAEFQRATDKVEGTRKLLDKGYVNKGELEADELDLTRAQISLDKARTDKELFIKFEKSMEESKRITALAEAEEELLRIKASSERELKSKESELISAKSKFELENLQLTTLQEQLKNTVIFAPQAGMVVYSQDQNSRWGGSTSRIEEGAQVRNRQKLIELPDFSAWRVETRVHESMIQQVEVGQTAMINIDALNNRMLQGNVSRIGVLPDSSRWFMPDTKEYLVNIYLSTTTLPLKPGMSAKTEIMLERLRDVLYVPMQAITMAEGKTAVWLKAETGPRQQAVTVGLNNDRFVEIKDGLNEGQEILLTAAFEPAKGAGVVDRPSERKDEEKDEAAGEEKTEKSEEPAANEPQQAEATPETDKPSEEAKDETKPAVMAEEETAPKAVTAEIREDKAEPKEKAAPEPERVKPEQERVTTSAAADAKPS